MRLSHLHFGVLLLGGLLLCGCTGSAAKRRAAKQRQTAGVPPGGASRNAPTWQGRLGRVVLVNSGLDFVLIDAGTAPVPEPGTRLRAYAGEEPSAELCVSVHQQRPFLIADILSGNPRVSDMVVPVQRDASPGEGRTVSKKETPVEASASAPTVAPRQFPQERSNSQELLPPIERQPLPPSPSLLIPSRPAGEDSQAIIPGLPSSGKNSPR